ncbi:MAG: SH3 domain-containing protein [Clostridia bacterium]|nr:SH3 domain-containing protein [Clostridia bacterium]
MTNLKKATIASIVILVLITGVAIASFAITSGTANKDAKLRKTTSNDSIVLEIIPKKDEVEILEDAGDWYKVNYKKIKGYVQKEFIDVIEESSQIYETEDKKDEKTGENQVDLKKGDTALTKTEIKLYMRPLINSKIITKLSKDKQVIIEQIRNNWAYINVEGMVGWTRLDSLKAKDQENVPAQTDNKENTTLNKTAYISSTGINFREEPNTDSKVLKVFSQNAKITILEEQGTWYKIKHNDQEGYVLKEYVSNKKVEITSRSAEDRTKTTTENKDTESTSTKKVEEKTTTKTSSKGQDAANYVKQFVGCKYVYGGSTPKGFDCSGLTMYVYKKYGINLSHSATAQSKVGTKVERANLQPGDLVFFRNYRTNKGIGHVGIYIGNNKFVHASTEKTGVITSTLSGSYSTRYVTARRIF